MQFSTLLALAPLFMSMASAAPFDLAERDTARLPSEHVSAVIAHLDSSNQVQWTSVAGGRLTFIPHDQGLAALNTMNARREETSGALETRKKHSAKWQDVGPIDGHHTQERCTNSGTASVLVNLVSTHFADACGAFFGATTVGSIIDKGWHVFQATGLATATGLNAAIDYHWQNAGTASEIVPTEALCNRAAAELMVGPCVSTGQTAGADIKMADTLGWVLGYSPIKI